MNILTAPQHTHAHPLPTPRGPRRDGALSRGTGQTRSGEQQRFAERQRVEGEQTDIYRPHALFSMATGEGSRQVTFPGH